MRIAMIGQKGMPARFGGVERHVHDLSVHLVDLGHVVTVYSRAWYTPRTIDNSHKGVQIVHTPSIKTKHLDTISHVFSSTIHALFCEYDIIHYHGVGPALLSWIPRIFKRNTKIVITFHSIDRYHEKWSRFAKWFLRLGEWSACLFAHDTITVSQSLQNYCLKEFDMSTHYIPNGVYVVTKNNNTSKLHHFGLEKDKYIVMISRLVPHKGAHLLIEAFHHLKAHHADDAILQELKLAIVGGPVYTNEYVRQLHLQASNVNDIIFTDFQEGETLEQLYQHAQALIHPSLNEGLPITVLTAMSYEKPVLLSTIPEHIELVHDVRALFKDNDVDAIEQILYDFINLGSEEKKSMGQQNKQIVESMYCWKVITPQIEKIYRKPIQKTKRKRISVTQEVAA